MIDMQPHRGEDKVAIPFTFDAKYDINHLNIKKFWLAVVIQALLVIFWIVILIIAEKDDYRVLASIAVWLIAPTILRYALIGEHRFRKGYVALKEKNNTFNYSLFWNIYDTSTTSPTFFYHRTLQNSIFVAFDKDVIVGKGDDSDFAHYDALSEAYNLLSKKGIMCTHIDYMDNVGKDNRLQEVMDELQSCPAQGLRDRVYDIYEYMQYYMSDTFSDYDVYCFTANMRTDLLYDELEPVFNAFMNANYIRYRVLDRQDVRGLVAAVMGIPDFSVTRTCDNLFVDSGATNVIKIIWTEKNGVREKVNKTREELAAEAKAAQEAKYAKKHGKKVAMPNQQGTQLSGGTQNAQQNVNNTPVSQPTRMPQRQQVPANIQKLRQAGSQKASSRGSDAAAQAAFAQLNQQAEQRAKLQQANSQIANAINSQTEEFNLFGDDSDTDEFNLFDN